MQSGQNAAGHPALEEGAGPGLGLQPRGLSTLLGSHWAVCSGGEYLLHAGLSGALFPHSDFCFYLEN